MSLLNTFGLDPAVMALGGLIVGNMFTANGVISTAQSSALFFNQPSGGPFCATPPCDVVVPGPVAGAGVAGLVPVLGLLGFAAWRRRKAA